MVIVCFESNHSIYLIAIETSHISTGNIDNIRCCGVMANKMLAL